MSPLSRSDIGTLGLNAKRAVRFHRRYATNTLALPMTVG